MGAETVRETGVRRVRHAAVTASQEILPSAREAVARAVRQRVAARRQAMREERRRCPLRLRVETTRMYRSVEGGCDDLRFLYPVVDNVPVLVFPLLHFASTGLPVTVYSSPEAGRVVDVVRDHLLSVGMLADPESLRFVREDRDDLSLYAAILRATEPFTALPEGAIVWSAADLVLAYDVYPWLEEPEIAHHDLVVNMMPREGSLPPGTPELFHRNYFDYLEVGGPPGRVLEVKQPDLLVFTPEGRRRLVQLDRLRRRKGDDLPRLFLRTHWRRLVGPGAAALWRAIRYGMHRRRRTLTRSRAIHEDDASVAASLFFGVGTRIQARIADPLVIKDADSFEDLFGFYRNLLQGVVDGAPNRRQGYERLARLHPHARHLYELSRRLRPLWHEIPLWRHWPELIRDRIATCNRELEGAFREADLGEPVLVPDYFAADGSFRHRAAPHEDLAATRAYLAGPYRRRFEAGRAAHLAKQSPQPFSCSVLP